MSGCATPPPTAKRWESEVRRYERSDRRQAPDPGGVLFTGSSSIRMWKDLAADFPGVRAINRGFGGAQVADVTYYADRLILPHRPRRIIFYAGDNDLADGRTPVDVAADFTDFLDRVRSNLPGVPVTVISIKPSPAREHLLPAIRAANAALQRVVSTQSGLSYVDVFQPMLAAGGQVRPDLFEADGLHLNRDGYLLWREVLRPHLAASLAAPQ